MNSVLFSEEEEPDASYMDEIDRSIARDQERKQQLPRVPTTVPKAEVKVNKTEGPIAELA